MGGFFIVERGYEILCYFPWLVRFDIQELQLKIDCCEVNHTTITYLTAHPVTYSHD